MIDPLISVALYFIAVGLFGGMSEDLGAFTAVVFPLAYFVWFIVLLGQGYTPGKKLLGLHVVNSKTGNNPGFGAMFLREIVGRVLSALFFGIGYFWALFDKNSQAWHDKLANTVVVRKG